MSSLDYLDLCRLCLVKDRVSVPIFEGEGDVRQIFLKIASCLPVKVTREDKLPKKICDDCVYKVELFYQFWNTTANAEKQLLQWIGEVDMDEKSDYVTEVLNSEQTENRLEMMQSAEEQSNNIEINMMDGMGLGLPIIMSTNEQMSSNPITSSANVQSVQSVGSTTQAHSQLVQKDGTHEEEENTEDECDVDDGMHVKDENDSSVNDSRSMETSYVSVPLDCDEAGPSGLQQQKLSDMTDMEMAQQSAEGDIKVGRLPLLYIKVKPRLIKPPKDLSSRILLIRQKYLMKSKNYQTRNILKLPSSKSPVIIKNPKLNNLSTLSKDTSVSLANNKTHKKIPFLKTYYEEYFCDLCNYKNKRKAALAVHVARKHIHNAEKKEVEHICRLCDITFRCKPSLQTHWIRKHTEKFNFFCPKCGKKFKIKGELTTHLRRMHSDVSWKCEVCGNFYRSQHALYTHQKAYHFKPDFQCPYCPKCLVTQENLNQHIRLRHEKKDRAMCEECGKTFNEMWDLRKHQRVHTGEKPFPCSVCNRRFSRLAILNQHLLIHTGVRVYSCDVCNRSFTQKSGLISHRKKHSGNLPPLPVVYVQDIIKPFKESQTVL